MTAIAHASHVGHREVRFAASRLLRTLAAGGGIEFDPDPSLTELDSARTVAAPGPGDGAGQALRAAFGRPAATPEDMTAQLRRLDAEDKS